ncbi:ribonuclease HII [Sphingobacterium sp. lm-10]|uniref:ribonuclease HII n=1 Tax=Sphingobacterium sp. lm-10 TaxID=2944904 RepID=UPI002021CAA0|nr:ribonuclease HII [Sphingobacterium sp. lm-10]MCL7988362.1 ribonuclease HII [Sphingobacterium sp. lm-10]
MQDLIPLWSHYQKGLREAGCDEAGRGCLAGPVFAAAVVFPVDYFNPVLNDSKKLSEKKRSALRTVIEQEALDFAVASVSAEEIDKINIHQASYLAMHRALDMLNVPADYIIVDGNKFVPYQTVPYTCIVKGDGKYLSIAAASILAKTYRDEYMHNLAAEHPDYDWLSNKGYPTVKHRNAILQLGLTPHHRKTFRVTDPQLRLF